MFSREKKEGITFNCEMVRLLSKRLSELTFSSEVSTNTVTIDMVKTERDRIWCFFSRKQEPLL